MLQEQIDQDFKTAFKAKDDTAKAALGNLRAALKSLEIDNRQALTTDEVVQTVAKKVKQHKDSIAEFAKGGREDLVANETSQMRILQKYLPQQLSDDEVRQIVMTAIAELSATPKDFGQVMKAVLAKASGTTDGVTVSKIVKEELK